MEINKNTSERFLDILLIEIVDVTKFSIKDILFNNSELRQLGKDDGSAIKICEAVLLLGKTYDYLEVRGNGIFKLTEKGVEAKAKGGHVKYQKYIKKNKMSLFEIISTPVIILTLALAIYQEYKNRDLDDRFKKVNNKIEVLENDLKDYKDSLKLNKTFIEKLKAEKAIK
jgi:hypothetical protein